MKYTGYRLDFTTAVHLGAGHLEDAEYKLYADTIFSALCHEALAAGNLDELVSMVKDGRIKISDAFPCSQDTYYIPKPMVMVDSEGDSVIKKKAKKLEYIPADKMNIYLSGKMDIISEEKSFKPGTAEIRTQAAIFENADTKPYSVGAYSFNEGWGLYLILGYEDDECRYLIEELLEALGYSGIGGKRSSGLGKFVLRYAKLPDELVGSIVTESDRGRVMSLSVSMCSDELLDEVCDKASYMMMKRSGFISSYTYAEQFVKKQDMYCFKAGSVFEGTFDGVVKDVSIMGTHPVYRYAMPIFMEVK